MTDPKEAVTAAILDFLQSDQVDHHILPALITHHGRKSVGDALNDAAKAGVVIPVERMSNRDRGTVLALVGKYRNMSADLKREFEKLDGVVSLDAGTLADADLLDLSQIKKTNSSFLREMERRLRASGSEDFVAAFNAESIRHTGFWFGSTCQFTNVSFVRALIDRSDVTPAFMQLNIGKRYDAVYMEKPRQAEIHTHIAKNPQHVRNLFAEDPEFGLFRQVVGFLDSFTEPACLETQADNVFEYAKTLASLPDKASLQQARVSTRETLAPAVANIIVKADCLEEDGESLQKLMAGLSALDDEGLRMVKSPSSSLLESFIATQVKHSTVGEKAAVRIATDLGSTQDEMMALASCEWRYQMLQSMLDRDLLLASGKRQHRGMLLSDELGL